MGLGDLLGFAGAELGGEDGLGGAEDLCVGGGLAGGGWPLLMKMRTTAPLARGTLKRRPHRAPISHERSILQEVPTRFRSRLRI